MGDSVAGTTISFALETLRDLVVEEAKFLRAVKGQAKHLQQELGHIQRFVKEAEAKEVDKKRIKEWVMEFKEIAYDAEDVLESYAFKVGSSSSRKRWWWLSINEIRLKHEVGLEIKDIITKISNLKDSFKEYGVMRSILKDGSTSSSSRKPQQLRRSYSHVLERDFVGLENETEILAQHLVQGDHMVVSIYGMGGLGKTTLAQKVYNHPLVKSHFDASAWVCISQEWDQSDILQSILTKLFPDRRDEVKKLRVEELVRELFEAQSGNKKIFFVLDDIWETGAWESIKDVFGENAKILLTTRKKDVALAISPRGFHYQPPLLDDEHSWELLQKKSHSKSGTDKDFEALGRKMVKHCGGLPLAIIVLGGILATRDSMDEWKNVDDNIQYFIGSKVGKDDHLNVLDDILSLSYDDLPPRLKPCFLYMASFEEDESIDAQLLYHMWMAEGLVSMEDRKGEDEVMINVAERYLGELVERCMVQVEALDFPMIVKFESCRLHDIMRDLCMKKAREENFLVCINDGDKKRSIENDHVSRIRRLRMTIDSKKALEPGHKWPLPDGMEKHVRSLQLYMKNADKRDGVVPLIKARLKCYRLLKVLTIGDYDYDDETPTAHVLSTTESSSKDIGKMYNLRFLRIFNSKLFAKDPVAIFGKLEHLQTLDLRGIDWMISEALMENMRELRYLYLPRDLEGYLEGDVLRLGSLHKLEVLENFNLSYCNAKDLSQMTNLVQLVATVRKPAEQLCDAVADLFNNINSYLGQLKHLSLEIHGHLKQSTLEFALLEDKTTLVSAISISQLFQISKVPIGPADPSKFLGVLNVLELDFLSIEQDCIGILETKLPNLQFLAIRRCKGGKKIRFHPKSFPKLKLLHMESLYDLEKWSVDQGAMPNLLKLTIWGCKKLGMIPDGLKKVTTLKLLEIIFMPTEFKNRLRKVNENGKEGADFHKISHIPSIEVD